MQSQYFCFTRFANHGSLVHEEAEEQLQQFAQFYCFQSEICPESGREHLQGYVVLHIRTRISKFVRDFPCNAQARKGTHTQALAYCEKEETRKPGTVPCKWGVEPVDRQGRRNDLESFHGDIISGATDWELLGEHKSCMAKYPRYVYMVRNALMSFNVLRNLPSLQPRLGWQFELAQRLSAEPHPRKVLWRWDRVGNVGKSYFALHWKPLESFIVTGGKYADIHYAYNYEGTIFFDWPRCNEGSFPYGLVEQFKNGYFFSTKYQSVAKRFQVPHVVVLANFPPDETQMSEDRWDIKECFQ